MHLGNYLGAISNWARLQKTHESIFLVVDLHALTTVRDPHQLRTNSREMVIDILAAGVDPSEAIVAIQSQIPGHSILHTILSMITPLPWLERVPTYKGKLDGANQDLNTYGFLGYPNLQAADILLYQGEIVPIGNDQVPHLELTREIARRFNHFYGTFFKLPAEILTAFPTLPGTDGRKMSKSYGNTIPVSSSEAEIKSVVRAMFTDPNRKRRQDPGTPDHCPVYKYHTSVTDVDRQVEIASECKTAGIGCVDCKQECATNLNKILAPVRDRRHQLTQSPGFIDDVLHAGSQRANVIADRTLAAVSELVGLGQASKI